MKLHLPIALLTAVICTVSAHGGDKTFTSGGTIEYTYCDSENDSEDDIVKYDYDGKIVATVKGDATSGINDVAKNYTAGLIGAIDPDLCSRTGAVVKETELNITGSDTKATYVTASAPRAYAITGNKTLNIEEGAHVDVVYAGYYYGGNPKLAADTNSGAFSEAKYGNSYAKGDKDAVISINVNNASIMGMYVGTYYGSSVANNFVGSTKSEQHDNAVWALNERIDVNLTNAKVGYNADGSEAGENTYIMGGGFKSAASVNNSLNYTISGESHINGSIRAGVSSHSSIDAYSHDVNVTMNGGIIDGSICAGGAGDTNSKAYVKGNTQVVLAGGEIKGNVYGGGTGNDIVEGNSIIVIKGSGSTVGGTIYGGGVNSETSVVNGDRILAFDSATDTAIETFVLETKSKNFNAVGFQNMGTVNIDDKYNRFDTLYVSNKDASSTTTVTTTLGRDGFKKAVVDNKGMLTLTGTSMKAENLVIKDGGTVSFVPAQVSQQVVAADFSAAAAEGAPVVTLASKLELGSGSTLLLNGYVLDLGANDLTVYAGAEIWTIDSTAPATLAMTEEVLSGFITTTGAVAFYDAEGNQVGSVEATVNGQTGTLGYTNGAVTFTAAGGGSTPSVPEPATATLSLLALAGLCARRRRK